MPKPLAKASSIATSPGAWTYFTVTSKAAALPARWAAP
jgi:hypothetical protein